MLNTKLTTAALGIYILAWIVYTLGYLRNKDSWSRSGFYLTLVAVGVHFAGFLMRWYESYKITGGGHIPVANLYEALTFFAMVIGGIFLIVERRYSLRWTGSFVLPVIFLTLAYTSFLDKNIEPLIPALQSNWLTVHVITSFLGYAGFAVAFAAGIFYLVQQHRATSETLEKTDATMYVSVGFGFIMLTLGIITGAVWANYAWGSYWSWDPKETWSLITWLVYGALLHARFTMGWKGKRTAIMSVVGFIVTMFCFLGVNLFLSGLHSYAG